MTPGEKLARNLLLFIAVATMATGFSQMILPSVALRVLHAESTPTSAHFIAIVGMFMLLFGGIMWQALRTRPEQPKMLFWCMLQKFGASIAVALLILDGIVQPLAWGVSLFDGFTGVLALWYWNRIRGDA